MSRTGRLPRSVDTPGSWSGEHEKQKDEAIEDCGIAAVEGWIDALWGVKHPVGHGHLACQDEGDWAGQKANEDQKAAYEF
jgi:hypothetical protein